MFYFVCKNYIRLGQYFGTRLLARVQQPLRLALPKRLREGKSHFCTFASLFSGRCVAKNQNLNENSFEQAPVPVADGYTFQFTIVFVIVERFIRVIKVSIQIEIVDQFNSLR